MSQVLLDRDGKGHESSEKNYVPWHNIHVQMQPSTYNKTPN